MTLDTNHPTVHRWRKQLHPSPAPRTMGIAAVLALLVAISATFAPAQAQDATPAGTDACPVTTEEENEAIVMRWEEEVHGAGNLDTAEELLADDHHLHQPVSDDVIGVDQRLEDIQEIRTAFPDLTVTVHAVFTDGEYVITRWTAVGTFTGPLGDTEPTGVQLVEPGMTIFRIECGQIAEMWVNDVGIGIYRQLGIVSDEELQTVDTPTFVLGTPAP